MTAADLLDRMNILDNELDVAADGDDEDRALVALDMAQDWFETIAAGYGGIVNGSFSLTASGASTTWPSGVLRIDSLHFTDNAGEIYERKDAGAHLANDLPWPLYIGTATPGRPGEFFAVPDDAIYWLPTADASYGVTGFGYKEKADLTARATTFGHPNVAAGPIVSFAVKLLEMGVDDPDEDVSALAEGWFKPVLKLLRARSRTRPVGRFYTRTHHT